MHFDDIPVNSKIKNQLIQLYHTNRVPHALLFDGSQGCGHYQLALGLASLLLCKAPSEQGSCGDCGSCRKVNSFQHPDLHFSFPIHLSKTNKTEISDDLRSDFIDMVNKWKCIGRSSWYKVMGNQNKQGVLGVKESQAIFKKLNLKSYEGGAKICIIWLPEMMNMQAANKLLKLIEEPPNKTYFLLVSDKKENLLPTISSRLQTIQIPTLEVTTIESYLKHQFNCENEQANKYANISNGDLHNAISHILDQEKLHQNLPEFIKWMRLCYTRNISDTIDWVNDFSKSGREQIKDFLLYSLEMLRQCVLGHYNVSYSGLSEDETAFLSKFSPFIHQRNIADFHDVVNEAYYHMERNANSKILLLDVSLKVYKLLKKANSVTLV